MTFPAELTRFLADHATAESRAAFASGVGPAPTAANLAAAMSAKGYQVSEAEVVAALASSKQVALVDQKLDGVVGGQAGNLSELRDRVGAEKYQEFLKLMVSDMVEQTTKAADRATDRMKRMREESEGS